MARCKRCSRRVNEGARTCSGCGVAKPVEATWVQIAVVWTATAAVLVLVSSSGDVSAPKPVRAAFHYLVASVSG